jgi:hypothetical protein
MNSEEKTGVSKVGLWDGNRVFSVCFTFQRKYQPYNAVGSIANHGVLSRSCQVLTE